MVYITLFTPVHQWFSFKFKTWRQRHKTPCTEQHNLTLKHLEPISSSTWVGDAGQATNQGLGTPSCWGKNCEDEQIWKRVVNSRYRVFGLHGGNGTSHYPLPTSLGNSIKSSCRSSIFVMECQQFPSPVVTWCSSFYGIQECSTLDHGDPKFLEEDPRVQPWENPGGLSLGRSGLHQEEEGHKEVQPCMGGWHGKRTSHITSSRQWKTGWADGWENGIWESNPLGSLAAASSIEGVPHKSSLTDVSRIAQEMLKMRALQEIITRNHDCHDPMIHCSYI